MNIVIHLWSDIADPDSFLGMRRIIEASAGRDIDIEHHSLDRAASPSDEAQRAFAECERHISTDDTSEAHALIYAIKASKSNPVEAARAGLEAALALGDEAASGRDISSTDVLSEIAERFAVSSWSDPAFAQAVQIDKEDAERVHATCTPFVIIGGLVIASGLKSVEEYRDLIDQVDRALSGTADAAWDEISRSDPSA